MLTEHQKTDNFRFRVKYQLGLANKDSFLASRESSDIGLELSLSFVVFVPVLVGGARRAILFQLGFHS